MKQIVGLLTKAKTLKLSFKTNKPLNNSIKYAVQRLQKQIKFIIAILQHCTVKYFYMQRWFKKVHGVEHYLGLSSEHTSFCLKQHT